MTYTFRSMLLLLAVSIVASGMSGCASKGQDASQMTAQEALRGPSKPGPITAEQQADMKASQAIAAKSMASGASAAAAAAKQAQTQHH